MLKRNQPNDHYCKTSEDMNSNKSHNKIEPFIFVFCAIGSERVYLSIDIFGKDQY